MDTLPLPPGAVAAAHGGLDEFRLDAPAEIAAMLKRLLDGNVSLGLNAPNGHSLNATLWTIDATRGHISFSVDLHDPSLSRFVEADEAVVVGYLDSVKLQFDVSDLVLVHGPRASVLSCAFPRELYRFQRRGGFRVRPVLNAAPTARMRHPMIPDMQLELRVLDVSIGGCALFLPDDVPSLPPGVLINGVVLEMDADTRVTLSLRVQHVTALNPDSQGVRLGCEMVEVGSEGVRSLAALYRSDAEAAAL